MKGTLARSARPPGEAGAAVEGGVIAVGRWNGADWTALSILFGLIIFFFWPLISPDETLPLAVAGTDFSRQSYPYHFFAAAEWWAGRIPLWNPYMFGGHPFQADIQTAVFYPLGLLVNLLAGRGGLPFRALEWQGIIDFLLAALFTYLFLRTVIRDRLAAAMGAATFALGGYLTSYPFKQFAVLETSVWLPLILLLIEMGVRRGEQLYRWWAGAGLVLAIAVLAGHPQTTLYIGYTALAYLVYRSWRARNRPRQVLTGVVAFGLTAAGGAAVQLLPTLEFIGLSNRARIPYEMAASGYDYFALPGLFLPHWRNENALYLGVAPLLLAIVALRGSKRREVIFWAALALVALVLSFGDRGYLYRLFHMIAPGFASFQDQERSAFVFSFSGTVLAAYGLAELRKTRMAIAGRFWLALFPALAIACAVGIFLIWPKSDLGSPAVDTGFVTFLVLLAICGGLLAIHALSTRGGKAPRGNLARGAVWCLAALTIVDLLAANWRIDLAAQPQETAAQQAAVEFLKLQEAAEGEPLRVRPQSDAVLPANYGNLANLPFASGDSPLVTARTQDIFSSGEEWRLWQLLNVKYVVGLDQNDEALDEVFAAPPLKVYRNRFSLPRAWVVDGVEVAASGQQAKDRVLSPSFKPGRTAVVESPVGLDPPKLDQPAISQRITFDYYSPRRLFVHTQTDRPGLLVLSENYYPGWQAKRDGQPVPVLRTDYILRGIELPAGDHVIEMVYNPASFWIGLVLTVLTLVAATSSWLWPWWRARRRKRMAAIAARTGAGFQTEATGKQARHTLPEITALLFAAVGFAMRLYHLDYQSLWLDEGFSVRIAREPFDRMMGPLAGADPHPPLYYGLLHVWRSIAGETDFTIRLLSVFFSIIAVVAIYGLGRQLVGRRAALAATLLTAVNPFQIWYAQEARMYAMLVGSTALSALLFYNALQRSDRRRWAAYTVVTFFAMFTHYHALFAIVFEDVVFLLWWAVEGRRSGRGLRSWLVLRRFLPPVSCHGSFTRRASSVAGRAGQATWTSRRPLNAPSPRTY